MRRGSARGKTSKCQAGSLQRESNARRGNGRGARICPKANCWRLFRQGVGDDVIAGLGVDRAVAAGHDRHELASSITESPSSF
jgi:hypothetical protein